MKTLAAVLALSITAITLAAPSAPPDLSQMDAETLRVICTQLYKTNADLQAKAAALQTENAELTRQNKLLISDLTKLRGAAPQPLPAADTIASADNTPARESQWSAFRGIQWGTRFESVPNLVHLETDGDMKFYRRENERMTIGGAELTQVIYGFYKGRFGFAAIRVKGHSNCSALKDAVFATYGKGTQTNKLIEEWYWGGRFPIGAKDVEAQFKKNPIIDEASFSLFSVPISKEREADAAAKAKKAADDF